MASEFEPPKTYWDPYSRTQKPVLTQEEVDQMWPNIKVKKKPKPEMDDCMPTIPPAEEKLELPLGPKAQRAAALNVATAPARLGIDMVNLPPHYARFKIEPIRFIGENRLDWFQGNIIKYVCRHDAKNGIEDIDKVGRYQQMYKLYLLGDPDWWKAGKPEDFKSA